MPDLGDLPFATNGKSPPYRGTGIALCLLAVVQLIPERLPVALILAATVA
ncbi:hypothetical protein AB0F68_16145 [Micromonospora sp. NPDC023966]